MKPNMLLLLAAGFFALSCSKDTGILSPRWPLGQEAAIHSDQPSDEFDLQLKVGRIKCSNPGNQCSRHEWRATFEVLVLDGNQNCINVVLNSEWVVDYYGRKSLNQPEDWGDPFTYNGCFDFKALLSMDGEWYPNIAPEVWWVRARVRNTVLNFDIDLIMRCDFTPGTQEGYECHVDYDYGLADELMDRFVIGTTGCQ